MYFVSCTFRKGDSGYLFLSAVKTKDNLIIKRMISEKLQVREHGKGHVSISTAELKKT